MPLYDFRCQQGHNFTAFHVLDDFGNWAPCVCGGQVEVVIGPPTLIMASPDVCYDSPIDGRPITSMQAREEDLKRNGCTPYDPMAKQDYDRRAKESDAELDQAIEATVEEAVGKMDGRTRAKLASELLDQGVTADVVRVMPHA